MSMLDDLTVIVRSIPAEMFLSARLLSVILSALPTPKLTCISLSHEDAVIS